MSTEKPRAEIVPTNHEWKRAGRIEVNAPIADVFELIADPRMHAEFDGSGTVQRQIKGPDRLSKGATFGMAMRVKFPYTITNTVEEFDEPGRIAWRIIDDGHRDIRWQHCTVPAGTEYHQRLREQPEGNPEVASAAQETGRGEGSRSLSTESLIWEDASRA
jgi:uncharacterized protein YndB with AHSA1/START domain